MPSLRLFVITFILPQHVSWAHTSGWTDDLVAVLVFFVCVDFCCSFCCSFCSCFPLNSSINISSWLSCNIDRSCILILPEDSVFFELWSQQSELIFREKNSNEAINNVGNIQMACEIPSLMIYERVLFSRSFAQLLDAVLKENPQTETQTNRIIFDLISLACHLRLLLFSLRRLICLLYCCCCSRYVLTRFHDVPCMPGKCTLCCDFYVMSPAAKHN